MAAFGLWGDNPYDASAAYLDQIPEIQQQYLGMYNRGGHVLYPSLGAGYGQMALHPGKTQARLGESFEADPGYQWQLDQELQANDQAMAAGGMSGSPQSQQFAEQTAQGFADKSYNNFMNRQLGIMEGGLGGLQGLENQGFKASGQMANSMTDYLYNRANLAGAQAKNRSNIFWGGLGYMLSPSVAATPAPIESLV